MDNLIQHPGVIIAVKDEVAEVKIVQSSACAGCHAKSACSLSDKQEKIIEISLPDDTFHVGDEVLVLEKSSLGLKAVFYSYVLPMLIILFTLIFIVLIDKSDIFAGVAALTVLAVYYIIFSFFRNKLKRTFIFSMKKPNKETD